jgi:uncharacterized membrane protein YsdA (DUF1294 family)
MEQQTKKNSYLVYGLIAGLMTGAITFALWFSTELSLLGSFGVGINVGALFLTGLDKSLSRSGSLRIPEVIFFVMALCGGAPGTILGIHVFRHKTRKAAFQFVLLMIVVAQVYLVRLLGVSLRGE